MSACTPTARRSDCRHLRLVAGRLRTRRQKPRAGVGHPQRKLVDRSCSERRRRPNSSGRPRRDLERVPRSDVDGDGVGHDVERLRDGLALRRSQAQYVGAELLARRRRANSVLVGLSTTTGEVCLSAFTNDGSTVALIADAVGWVPGTVSRGPVPAPPVPAPSGVHDVAGRPACRPVPTAPPVCVPPSRSARRTPRQHQPRQQRQRQHPHRLVRFNRVDGDFAGTTDEIIQWAACKWGIDEDIVRAQVIKESCWYQSATGDNGESWGLGQVRAPHPSAFQFPSTPAPPRPTTSTTPTPPGEPATKASTPGSEGPTRPVTCGAVALVQWSQNNADYIASVQANYNSKVWLTSTFING